MEEQAKQEKSTKPAKETKAAKACAKTAVAEKPASAAADKPREQRPARNNNNNRPQPRAFNNNNAQPVRQPNGAKVLDARELNKLSVAELTKLAVNYNLEDISGLRKQELIGRIMAIQAKQNGSVYGGGVLEILPDGFGFLRSEENKSPLRKLNALVCAKGIPLKGSSARPKITNVTLLCSKCKK